MYNPQKIEKKWQKYWDKEQIYKAGDYSKKKKQYILLEFPYPSGKGLHVGHCRPYVALDIVARKKRMENFNVLFPMGWDAFGLPTENYAIKTGVHPTTATKKNTTIFKNQQKSLGLSFDWTREINTTDPNYYKWTQWIFLQFFKKGLAYKKKIPINWCPSCRTGLANEEVIDGCCERCGAKVTKKEKEQWMLKITKYAKRLIKDLDKVDFPERVKTLEKDWIGKSEGYEVGFKIKNQKESIKVFTTRLDTIFGVTYLVLAPEHPAIEKLESEISNFKSVEKYIERTKIKLERERISESKEKTGIKLEGIKAINPITKQEIPIFIADYILMNYGTGAIMAVPAHDERDFDFAKKYSLPIIEVIDPYSKKTKIIKRVPLVVSDKSFEKYYEGEGILINSGRFTGMESKRAKEKLFILLKKDKLASKKVHYKLRDWIFSRQHYWGEPMPLVFCENCANNIKKNKKKLSKGELLNPGWTTISEKDLPLKLPKVKKYKPTKTGESPLSDIKSWVDTKCPICGGPAKRETDTMPNWAGSNWYYLRYCDPKNDKKLASSRLLKKWMTVDWYNGGMEHTTLHLLYSRFVYKFLWDIGAVPKSLGPEPYKKRTSHGMILGEGGIKMSKSKGNVINPNDVVNEYGADTLRIYEMFMGPFEEAIAWDSKGVKGARRFLDKIWNLQYKIGASKQNIEIKESLHKTIKKVSQDIDKLKLNTAISCLMMFVNKMEKEEKISLKYYSTFLTLLSPFAPHVSEEIWNKLGYKKSIFLKKWPKYNPKLIKENISTLIVQVNGKVRGKINIETTLSVEQAKKIALGHLNIKKWLFQKKIKRVIFVKGKLINFVI
jgi:leucyl-tRNA synthetase